MGQICGHCGSEGRLEHKSNTVVATEDIEDERGRVWGTTSRIWSLARCDACNKPTLTEYVETDFTLPDDWVGEVLFPVDRGIDGVPDGVKLRYNGTRKARAIEPSLYAVAVRRMLEAVCQDRGATGGTLYAQLRDLVNRGELPQVFAQMADQLRKLGNWGAHSTTIDVTSEEVPLIEDFAEALLDYLYRAPAKVERLERALEARTSDVAGRNDGTR